MNAKKAEQIRISLRLLAEAYAANIELLERTLALVGETSILDSLLSRSSEEASFHQTIRRGELVIDSQLLMVIYRGKRCFLGNSLPFHLFARLARRPNCFISNEQLLNDVWKGFRSAEAIRSVVKVLRAKLRSADMAELAVALDGSVRGHYALKLAS